MIHLRDRRANDVRVRNDLADDLGDSRLPSAQRGALLATALMTVINSAVNVGGKMGGDCETVFAKNAERRHAGQRGSPQIVGREADAEPSQALR